MTKNSFRYRLLQTLTLVLVNLPASAALGSDEQLHALIGEYNAGLASLSIPMLQIAWLDNLNNIGDEESLAAQESFFNNIAQQASAIGEDTLTEEARYILAHLHYQLNFHQTRVDLEQRFRTMATLPVEADGGIHGQPLGQEWYQYWLDRWLSVHRTPEELMTFGREEVAKVQRQLRNIIVESGLSEDEFYARLEGDDYLLRDTDVIEARYAEKLAVVTGRLSSLFHTDAVPVTNIMPFEVLNKDTPPGQARSGETSVFYYNFFRDRHKQIDMDYLILHEVAPGHIFHWRYDADTEFDTGVVSSIFAYHGLSEGWGAYVETLGGELGLYEHWSDKAGAAFFDLVRSVRVALDVGINHHGWSNEEALEYWHANIRGQDDIAQREIDRVRRWPAQAISYKVGSALFLELKAQAREHLGELFDIRDFHHQILAFGGVPLTLIEQRIVDWMHRG